MIVLVTGGRDFDDLPMMEHVLGRIHAEHEIELVMHGASGGADSVASEWAMHNNVSEQIYKTNHSKHGRRAPHVRNWQMAKAIKAASEHDDVLVVVFPFDGNAEGSMLTMSDRFELPVYDAREVQP